MSVLKNPYAQQVETGRVRAFLYAKHKPCFCGRIVDCVARGDDATKAQVDSP